MPIQLSRRNCHTFSSFDKLRRVEFGGTGRQWQQRDVVGDDEVASGVPAGTIQHQHGMGAASDVEADFLEMSVHRFRFAAGQDEAGPLALGGADRPEDVGKGGALVVRQARAGAATRPQPGQGVLLADARLILT